MTQERMLEGLSLGAEATPGILPMFPHHHLFFYCVSSKLLASTHMMYALVLV